MLILFFVSQIVSQPLIFSGAIVSSQPGLTQSLVRLPTRAPASNSLAPSNFGYRFLVMKTVANAKAKKRASETGRKSAKKLKVSEGPGGEDIGKGESPAPLKGNLSMDEMPSVSFAHDVEFN